MCIAISLPPSNELGDKEITNKAFDNCWRANPDGGGMAYCHNNMVYIHKGFMDREEFKKVFYTARMEHPDSNFLLHFRIASKGEVNKENTHPFFVFKDKQAMIHNGTISQLGTYDKGKSDTAILADILSGLNEKWYKDESLCELIDGIIGLSKIVFLTNENKTFFFNRDKFTEVDGIYYSNESFKRNEVVVTSIPATYEPDRYCVVCLKEPLKMTPELKLSKCMKCMTTEEWQIVWGESDYDNLESVTPGKCTVCEIELNAPMEHTHHMCFGCMEKEELGLVVQSPYNRIA